MLEYNIGGQERGTPSSGEGITDIPQNRTLLVEKLTVDPPVKPEVTYDLKTVEEVFDHFRPEVEVEFQTADGSPVQEKISFRSLQDFGKKGIVDQSQFLQELSSEELNYRQFIKVLKSNKILQKLLVDPEAKAAYLAGVQMMISELEEATQKEEE